MSYDRLISLDDPERRWRRVYACTATGIFVKVYAKPKSSELGQCAWELTASACDQHGRALVRRNGVPAVLGGIDAPYRHLLQVAADADVSEPLADLLEREVLFLVARVERAVLIEQQARDL